MRSNGRNRFVWSFVAIAIAALIYFFDPRNTGGAGTEHRGDAARPSDATTDPATTERATKEPATKPAAVDARVGFTSARALEEHFAKHGREFGSTTAAHYLRLAQELRDAPVSGSVREARRADGVITRFDTSSGAFVAFHADHTIRTFFKPNDGIRYFERQLDQEH